jgi:hypothetical protein
MSIGKKTGGGTRKGSPNKATAAAREAIALFVNRNAGRLQSWLDDVAEGRKGDPDEEGNETWVIHPNPVKAFELFQSVIEYHVPKLARTEVSGIDGKAIPVKAVIEFVSADKSAVPGKAPTSL